MKYFNIIVLLFLFCSAKSQEYRLSVQTGHTATINKIIFNPQNNLLASASADNNIILWDLLSRKQYLILSEHTKQVNDIAFHPTKKILASVSDDKTLKIWDYNNAKTDTTFSFEKELKSVCYSPDGKYLICGNNKIHIYNIKQKKWTVLGFVAKKKFNTIQFSKSGKYFAFGGNNEKKTKILTFNNKKVVFKYRITATNIKFSDDEDFVFISSNKGVLHKKKLSAKRYFWQNFAITINRSYNKINSLSINNELIAVSSKVSDVFIYDKKNGKQIYNLKGHTGKINSLCFNAEGNILVSAGEDRTIIFWDIKKANVINSLLGTGVRITNINFSNDGNSLIIGKEDGQIILWNIDKKTKIARSYIPETKKIQFKNSQLINSIIYTVYSTKKHEKYSTWDLNQNIIKESRYNKEDKIFISDTSLIFYNTPSHKKYLKFGKLFCYNSNQFTKKINSNFVKIYALPNDIENSYKQKWKVKNLYSSKDGNIILLNSQIKKTKQNTCFVLDIENRKTLFETNKNNINYTKIAISPQNKYLYLVTDNNFLEIWNLQTKEKIDSSKIQQPISWSLDEQYITYVSPNNFSEICIKNILTHKILKIDTKHTDLISDIEFNPKYNYLATASYDGLIKFWNIETGELIMSLATFGNSDFMYVDANNNYYISKKASKAIAFSANEQAMPFEQFDIKFNRPDIIFSNFENIDTSYIQLYNLAYKKRLQKMGFTEEMLSSEWHIPEIEILNAKELTLETNNNEISIQIHAWDTKNTLNRINIWINNVPIFGVRGISLKKQKINDYNKTIKFHLSTGENKIQISALNNGGAESYKQTIYINYTPKIKTKPDLYVYAVGVSEYWDTTYNLNYAAKDALDFANLFVNNKNEKYENIYVKTILNKEATRNNILDIRGELEKTKVDDQVIFFYAGHGILDDKLYYYLTTHRLYLMDIWETTIRYDELEALFDSIPARQKLILIDACHSGEVDEDEYYANMKNKKSEFSRGIVTFSEQSRNAFENTNNIGVQNSFSMMKILFSDLRRGNGAIVISSAGGGEFAFEGFMIVSGKKIKINNGVFTYSLLKGIQTMSADANKDGHVQVSELQDYVFEMVAKLTKGHQNPTARRENLEFDFDVW